MSTQQGVTLVTSGIHPKGRRFSPLERDAAYLVYAGAGRQNFVKTSKITGVSRKTLMQWADHDDWERRLDDSGSAVSSIVELAYATMPHLFRLGMDRAMKILDDDEGNQQAQAKIFLEVAGMFGMIAPKQSVSVVQHMSGEQTKPIISLKDLQALDPDQLESWSPASPLDDDTTAE